MFSTALCHHPIWSTAVPSLRTSSLRLRETRLEGHDIVISNIDLLNRHYGPNSSTQSNRTFRFLLLCPANVSPPSSSALYAESEQGAPSPSQLPEKITRFSSITGGQDAVIIFLIDGNNPNNQCTRPRDQFAVREAGQRANTGTKRARVDEGDANALKTTGRGSSEKGIHALMRLQIELSHRNLLLPILPLSSPSNLVSVLEMFLSEAFSSSNGRLSSSSPGIAASMGQRQGGKSPQDVLAHRLLLWSTMTTTPPLSEHAINVLSDVFEDVAHLAEACCSDAGRKIVREWIGDGSVSQGGEAEGVIRFFSPLSSYSSSPSSS